MDPLHVTVSLASQASESLFRRLLHKPPRHPYNPHYGPPLHPYDPDEFPLALPFALAACKDPAAESAFIVTLTWLGGRCKLLGMGEIPQKEVVRAHKSVYGGGEGVVGWKERVGFEELGWAAMLEVWRGMAVDRRWVVRDRSEFIGRCLGECWRVLENGGGDNGVEEGEERQSALDSAAWLAVRFWKRWRRDARSASSAQSLTVAYDIAAGFS